MNHSKTTARTWMWGMFAALLVLHHDWWFWTDGTLLLGFLPIGLAYHMLISLAAAGLWLWACFYAWPHELEEAPAGAGQGPSCDACGPDHCKHTPQESRP